MKKVIRIFDIRNLAVVLAGTLLLIGCGNSGNSMSNSTLGATPFGMTYIPSGFYTRGSGGQDMAYLTFASKAVTISSFFIDETETTNDQYHQFVNYVTDSIKRKMLGDALSGQGYLNDAKDGGDDDNPTINWKTKIKYTPEVIEALAPLYVPKDETFGSQKQIDVLQLNYAYYTFDYAGAAQKKTITADDKMGDPSVQYGAFVNRPQSFNGGRKNFIQKHVVNVYPDTLAWIFDFTYSYNEPMARSYFASPLYKYYPVVGVNWKQANAYCDWKTQRYMARNRGNSVFNAEIFRLPTEAEWEYAARGGLDQNPYPWGGPYARNSKGCVLANFKPGRGKYTLDGAAYPCIVGHFSPNDYGLYDMAGNVAEWCEDAYEESFDGLSDLNPVNKIDGDKTDKIAMKRKVIRGGSWKDFAEFTKVYTRDYEYQDSCKSYIGFRTVQSYMGINVTRGTGSNVY